MLAGGRGGRALREGRGGSQARAGASIPCELGRLRRRDSRGGRGSRAARCLHLLHAAPASIRAGGRTGRGGRATRWGGPDAEWRGGGLHRLVGSRQPQAGLEGTISPGVGLLGAVAWWSPRAARVVVVLLLQARCTEQFGCCRARTRRAYWAGLPENQLGADWCAPALRLQSHQPVPWRRTRRRPRPSYCTPAQLCVRS